MPSDAFYSISAFGTGDLKTGSPTLTISSGVATLSVAQTGNIGIGCRVTYDTSKVAYISAVNSSMSFDVVTAVGGMPSDEGPPVTVNSIGHEYASLSSFEAGYTDANHVNDSSLISADVVVHACCYYDHDDYTAVGAVEFAGVTMDATRKLIVFTPTGGTESIFNQRHSIADIPTVAEFEARSLPLADYTIVSDLGVVQTGDAFARIGATGSGLTSLATQASVNTVDSEIGDIQTDLDNATDGLGALKILIDAVKAETALIVSDTNELQTDDVPGLIAALDIIADRIEADTQDIQSRLPAALVTGRMSADSVAISGSTAAADAVEANIGNLDVASSEAATPAEVATALTDIHLDHLLAADYDPAAKPGVSTALLNELVEDDGGVSRYTVNALENAPSGTGASAETIADAVWDEAIADHTTGTTFGGKNQKVVPSETASDYMADIASLNDITVADIIAGIADGTYDLQEMMRVMFAVLSGVSSGGGTSTLLFKNAAEDKTRVTATVDADGNRTAMTLDGS